MIINITSTLDSKRIAYQIDVNSPQLSWVIQDIIQKNPTLNLPYPPDYYCLRMPGDNGDYLSNQNFRMFLRENVELWLKLAPHVEAAEAVFALKSNDDVKKKKTIFSLSKQFQDPLFAIEFIKKSGTEVIVDLITKSTGNTQAYALASLQSLMNNDVGWNNLGPSFIQMVVGLMVNPTLNICRYSTGIVTKLVCSGPNSKGPIKNYGFEVINEAMKAAPESPLPKIIERINDNDFDTQMNSLMLLNSMFQYASGPQLADFLDKLDSLNTRKAIMRLMQSTQNADVGKELITFQRLYYRELQRRKNTPIDRSQRVQEAMWNEIWTSAEIGQAGLQKMGFRSNSLETEMAPVGLLGLENMYYFVKKNKDFFSKFILEQNARMDGRRCPFALASIEVTRALLEHFQGANDEYADREPMILAFEDMCVIALQGLFKMWAEMEASESDMSKVIALVRTQLEYTCKDRDATIDQYRNALQSTPVKEVQKRQLEVMEAGDDLLVKVPVRNLRERVHKEAFEFVRDQRVSVLLKGAWFANYTAKGKSKTFRFYRLSPNKKNLHYNDFNEIVEPRPTLDQLPEKIELGSVVELAVAGNSPMFMDKSGGRKKVNDDIPVALTLSLVGQDENSIADFVAENTAQYSEWTDGLRVVLGKNLAAGSANRDTLDFVDSLTEIEVKIKLLDIRSEGVIIPDEAPPVPPPPPHYDFCYPTV